MKNNWKKQNFRLAAMKAQDHERLYPILNDPRVRIPFGVFSEKHFNRDTVAGWCSTLTAEASITEQVYVIKDHRKTIGYFGAWVDAQEPGIVDTWEIGYFLDPQYHRQGIVTSIATSFINAARGHGVKEISASVKPDNQVSRTLLERLGFEKTGAQEKRLVFNFNKDGSYSQHQPRTPMDIMALRLS